MGRHIYPVTRRTGHAGRAVSDGRLSSGEGPETMTTGAARSVVAIIPARGGSKGIPGKNLRLVGGQPLVAWSIQHARSTSAITRVFVSTDSPEIGDVALAHGAEVIQRPAEISGDTASSESCLVHALDVIKAADGTEPDLVVLLQPTSPIRDEDE